MNMQRLTTLLLCTLLLALPASARAPDPDHAAAIETEWLSVLLEGRKVGHARIDRIRDEDRVTTRQYMEFEVVRSGVTIVMTTQEEHHETPEGQPLAFASSSVISGLTMRVDGQRSGESTFTVQSGAADNLRESQLQWPSGALLSLGMEQALLAAGTEPGTRIELSVFQPLLQDAVDLVHEVVGAVSVDLPELGPTDLIETRQTLRFPGGDMISRVWMDDTLRMRKMTMDMMGQTLELLSCNQACAQAANQAAEILSTALVAAPRALTEQELAGPIEIDLHSDVPLSDWPGIDAQRLQALGEHRYRITTESGQGDPVAAPEARDLIATDWLDHQSPPVQALLQGIELDAEPKVLMERLERLVQRHIRTKNLNIGYASASDSARLREGDCTEHAVLLAALARAAGIPSRVVNGLAYSEDYEGGPSFVPHAWVAAWTGKQWRAYDAALPGNQLRIAMHADDGDPWRFYNNLEAFGRMRVDSIRRPEVTIR